MRKIIIPAVAVLALAAPSVASAWPAPVPGKAACIPNGDGTYHIDPAATPPFPHGSHQPEHGTCEGPVVPVPVPVPVPTPTPPPAPVPPVVPPVPTPPAPPSCGPGTKCCPVCDSRREYRWVIEQRYHAAGSRLDGQRIVSAVVKWRGAKGIRTKAATKVFVKGRTRLRGYADFRGRTVVKGFSAHITVIATLSSGRRVVLDEEVQLCIPPEGNPNAPTSSAPPSSRGSSGGTPPNGSPR